jgi:hypothetical protein
MRLIREKIKFKKQDMQIKLPLSTNSNLNGLQQSINDFVEEQTGLSINPVNDVDAFRYLPTASTNYSFYFYSGSSWYNTYEAAGFTTGETTTREEVVSRSFFLIQLYDTPDSENQILLHNGYYNGFNFISDEQEGNSLIPNYILTEESEFTNFYLPNSFIETLSGETTTIYGKLSFYNAKTGKLDLFYPTGATYPPIPTGDTDIYVEYQINPINKTYTVNSILDFKEFNNEAYVNKINDTLTSFTNQRPTYPTGTTFLNSGNYI